MTYIFAALAVYKTIQLIDALTPKEAMPWVKILVSIVLGYAAQFAFQVDNYAVGGFVIAALAGAIHAVLRLLTLWGDVAIKKTMR
jgi:hypothetical protein